MAKKAGSKSQAVRDYLAKKSDAGPKEIVEALAKKGIEVKDGLVSNIKFTLKKKGKKAGGKKKVVRRAKPSSGGEFDILHDVKKVLDKHGADRVKAAIAALERLGS